MGIVVRPEHHEPHHRAVHHLKVGDLAIQLEKGSEARCAKIAFQGLPARICWLGQGDRAKFGVAINDLVARGELSAPIAIGRDHLDTGSVASPFRECRLAFPEYR